MLFNSLIFPLFFGIVVFIYYLLNNRSQKLWLLLASYFFYGWWDWRFCSLLLFSTIVDWFLSQAIYNTSNNTKRKRLFTLSILTNLGILGFFKYYNFFADSFQSVCHTLGFQADFFTLTVILPVGISFYTFQTLSYTIDIYRNNYKPSSSMLDFALYVSFFPQLVAGPIERADNLLPQFTERKKFKYANIKSALPLILVGYFKKVVIADSLAPVVEQCWQNQSSISGIDLVLGVYAFAIQIYCDFSGYTDIARGVARALGVELMVNFHAPYFSRNITEFWRKWHISLSNWLKDYLYISLGGNRSGNFKTYQNLMITMLLGGLWHGAAWTFVIWGGLHGLFLAIHKMILKGKKPVSEAWGSGRYGYAGDLVNMIATFHLVCLSWIFFRADSLDSAISYIRSIAYNPGTSILFYPVFLAVLSLITVDLIQRESNDYAWINNLPSYWRYTLAGSLAIGTALVFGWHYGSPTPFIYFQF